MSDQSSPDILSRLENKAYTRHLLRIILTYLTLEDMVSMVRVSRVWRIMIMREVRPPLLNKIRHLHIVEARRKY